MQHLKHCVREILVAKELLSVPNSSFFSRSIARMVAIRTDDFIKSAFRVNKANSNSQRIKGDLNALKSLYDNYLATQRNKFGAHFQELDLASRFDYWQGINYESITFFIEIPLDIYTQFSNVVDYEPATSLVMPLIPQLVNSIHDYNDSRNIEKSPTIGVDSLALMRNNTGGMLSFSTVQQKAGMLKAIEIFVNYDFGLFQKVSGNIDYESLVKKMLITDVVSYADNLVSRTDIAPGAPQDEEGLNTLTNDGRFVMANKILSEFLLHYRFQDNLDKYRRVRNACCGHITVTTSLADLDVLLNSIDVNELKRFYEILRDTFSEVCSRDFLLRMFRVDPGERIYGATSMSGIEGLVSYDGAPFSETPEIDIEDVDDTSEYRKQFDSFAADGNENARRYFQECFARSELIETLTVTFGNETFSRYGRAEMRKVHLFLKELLQKSTIPTEKITAITLLTASAHTYPTSALKVLLDTYSDNSGDAKLNVHYLYAIGELCHDESLEVGALLLSNLNKGTFDEIYQALLAVFKIDIFGLRNRDGHRIATSSSPFVVATVRKMSSKLRCLMAMALLSHLYFNTKLSHLEKKVRACYIAPLESIIFDFIKTEIATKLKTDADRRDVSQIKACVRKKAFSTLLALLGDFYARKRNPSAALFFRRALYGGSVRFSQADFTELHNYACICNKLEDHDQAVQVAENIVFRNPWDIERRYILLSFYKADAKFLSKFQTEKQYILENFKLTPKIQKAVEDIVMSTPEI